jgi:hypothetical protein
MIYPHSRYSEIPIMKPFHNLKALPMLACTLGVIALSASNLAFADSKKWRANNNTDKGPMPMTVKVFWTADGCAGVKPRCEKSDGDVLTVCKTEILQPGESAHYNFNDGTSNRKKQVCTTESDAGEARRIIRATSDRKRNGIRHNDKDSAPEWYDD